MADAKATKTHRRSCAILSVLCVVTLTALVVVGWNATVREFNRVAPEEENVVSFLTKIGCCGIAKEGPAKNVVSVNLSHSDVKDSDLERLTELRHLRRLDLSNTQVTDAGIMTLASIESLEYINLSHTRVTEEGISALTRASKGRLKMVAYAGIGRQLDSETP